MIYASCRITYIYIPVSIVQPPFLLIAAVFRTLDDNLYLLLLLVCIYHGKNRRPCLGRRNVLLGRPIFVVEHVSDLGGVESA